MAGRKAGGVTATSHAVGDLERCHHIAGQARAQGAVADVDPLLEVVRTACPRCHAELTDPQRIYLPLAVIPRGNQTIYRCDTCGLERVDGK